MRRAPLANIFDAAAQHCFRCGVSVYQAEKLGPINNVIFHRNCFRCLGCGLNLTLQTYCTNQEDKSDREVYCQIHQPKCNAGAIDIEAVSDAYVKYICSVVSNLHSI